MAANPELVKKMGVSDENVRRINVIHDELEACLNETAEYLKSIERERLYQHFTDLEYALQRLWGFTEDHRYHTWGKRLFQRLREVDIVGNVYRCKLTGSTRTVEPIDINDHVLFSVGDGFVDFGGYNVRLVGVEQVK